MFCSISLVLLYQTVLEVSLLAKGCKSTSPARPRRCLRICIDLGMGLLFTLMIARQHLGGEVVHDVQTLALAQLNFGNSAVDELDDYLCATWQAESAPNKRRTLHVKVPAVPTTTRL